MAGNTTTKEVSFAALVKAAEGLELTKPAVVYTFGNNVEKLDSGKDSGIYEKP